MMLRTEQHRQNISEALTGRLLSSDHKLKISISLTGRKHSPEHNAAISEGLKRKAKERRKT